ncbi:hypothetical protein PoB_004910600 [Plakobranchus ocellatus]|uniref:Uncharacterized protein n=1 Tax=Plakobranchus ocellatus TaxID=259542 RepID=A0AAV4BGY3_9GAST|nr:hypothetical protein PoB_004910600 [Plakobranchus ocellatus]
MLPYLCKLELHEHYYIQGPAGCETDAAQLFAVMSRCIHVSCCFQKHIWEIVSAGKVAIIGVYVGRDKTRWSWEEIINKRLGFFTEVESTVLNKEPIYLKAYVLMDGWRYVPVIKRFLLHFMREGDQGTDIFFKENPLDFYTTVFTSAERAAFHYQNGGPLRGGNPLSSSNMKAALAYMDQKLLKLRAQSDFLEIHRLLLFRSLISDDTLHVVEAWRMFHSIAVRAEYVSSLAQSLADLVEFELEYTKFSNVEVSTITPMDGQDTASAAIAKKASPVNLGVVSTMLTALMSQAHVVSSERVSMLANSLPDYLTQKLSTVTEKDRRTGYVYPIIDERTISTLEEIAQMFLNVKVTIGCDVHNASDNAVALFNTIEARQEYRPGSVDSQILNDPQVYPFIFICVCVCMDECWKERVTKEEGKDGQKNRKKKKRGESLESRTRKRHHQKADVLRGRGKGRQRKSKQEGDTHTRKEIYGEV